MSELNATAAARKATAHVRQVWPTAMQYRTAPLPLNELIDAEFNAAQLRELAKWLDVKLKGNSKIGFTEQVVEALNQRAERMMQSADAVLEGLSSEQCDFVRRMFTARDHELPLSRGVAQAVWARQFDRDGDRKLVEVLDGLRRRALLFPTSPMQFGLRDVYYRWLPLGRNVPVHEFKIDPVKAKTAESASAAPGARTNFLDDFDAFLNALLKSGVTVREPLAPHAQSARFTWLRDWEHDAEDASRVLNSRPGWVPDPQSGIGMPLLSPFTPEASAKLENQTGLSQTHCEFMFALACAIQLVELPSPKHPTHLRVRASAVEEWLVLNNEDKLHRAWKSWTEEVITPLEARFAAAAARPADAFIIQRAIGARDLTPQVMGAEWCALRRYVTRALRGLPGNARYNWDDFRAKLFDFLPECSWTVAGRADWWFAHAGSRARLQPTRRDDWNTTLGKVIESIVRDSLAWFGAVEVTLDDDALQTFRVTDTGTWLICTDDCALPEAVTGSRNASAPITWSTDNTTLYAQPAPDRADFIALVRRVAERGEGSFTYVVTPGSIERALGEGITLDEVTRKFKRAGVTLPKAVSEQFKMAARRYGRVRLYEALTVLELADELTARELAANTSLLSHAIYQLSPRAFVVADDDVDGLVEEMQAKGYTPRVR